MSEDSRNILVGVLTLVVLLVVGTLSFGGKQIGAATGGYVIEAGFNRIDGLNVGDEVRLSGVKIGEVAATELGRNYRAVVSLRIDSGIEMPADTSAAIHTDSLFGAKHVVLQPGAAERSLGPGGMIEFTQDSVVVGELLDLIIGEARANAAKRDNGGGADAPSDAPVPGQGAPGSLMAPLLGEPPAAQ